MENYRIKGPEIRMINEVKLPDYQTLKLSNGIPLYIISKGTQELIKLEIVIEAGRPFELQKVASRSCNNQLKEGTTQFTSKELSEKIDYYGATIRTSENLDNCSITIYSLGKYFEELLPIVYQILTEPVFPENELQKFISLNRERLKIELYKNDVIAYRTITEKIFGDSHPYGYNSEIRDYENLNRSILIDHFQRNYGKNNTKIFLSGKIHNQHIKSVERILGNWTKVANPELNLPKIIHSEPQTISLDAGKEFQTAIKIGKRLFKRDHEDYPGLYFLNAILGGYFGSRLMTRIREEKGFTYNIYSEIDVMKYDGLFLIATEVSQQNVSETIDTIRQEFEKLKNEKVPNQELKMVKNYLLGRILNFIDGPFNTSRLIKSLIMGELPEGYFDYLISTIQNMNSDVLNGLANDYLSLENMWLVKVGKE